DRLLVPPLHLFEEAEIGERSHDLALVANLTSLGEGLLEEKERLDVVTKDGIDIADVRETVGKARRVVDFADDLQALLVGLQGLLGAAGDLVDVPQVRVAEYLPLAVSDVPADRKAISGRLDRLLVATQIALDHGQVVESDGDSPAIADPLPDLEGRLVILQGVVGPAQRLVRVAQSVEIRRAAFLVAGLRIQLQGVVEILYGLGGLPQLEAHASQRVMGVRVLGIEGDDAQQRFQGVVEVARVLLRGRNVEEG